MLINVRKITFRLLPVVITIGFLTLIVRVNHLNKVWEPISLAQAQDNVLPPQTPRGLLDVVFDRGAQVHSILSRPDEKVVNTLPYHRQDHVDPTAEPE